MAAEMEGPTFVEAVQTYYYKTLDKIWKKIPNFLGIIISTVIIFIAGSTMRGDWLLILVHFIRSFRDRNNNITNIQPEVEELKINFSEFSMDQLRLEGLPYFLIMNLTISYTLYYGLGGFLQWYFYIRQADRPEDWKCQPKKFLPPDQERHEIIWGSINVGFGAIVFATLSCYIHNGGYTSLYFNATEEGWFWLIFQIPMLFFLNDASSYYFHRLFHIPFLYKRFHKLHHIYKAPTCFSVTAFHPFEFFFYQSLLIWPAFAIKLNVVVYVVNLLYIYYYGIMNHSGIVMGDSPWPWQPDNIYHDNHHQYFNINFGFNLELWDKLHNTYKHVDNSLCGKNKPKLEEFRSEEDTLRFEKEHMDGIADHTVAPIDNHLD